MVDWIFQNANAIGSFIGGLIAGAFGGSILTLKFVKRDVSDHGGTVSHQTGAVAKGDVVGRDKISR